MVKKGITVWFTGLSGSGKSTISNLVAQQLKQRGIPHETLDGDILREGLTSDLGFSKEDRFTNIKRTAFVANLLSRNGVIVLASLITPYQAMRDYCRENIESFMEVYVKCTLDECIQRDVKGLYKKALSNEIKRFTGISDPFEEPIDPDLILHTDSEEPEESAKKIIDHLEKSNII